MLKEITKKTNKIMSCKYILDDNTHALIRAMRDGNIEEIRMWLTRGVVLDYFESHKPKGFRDRTLVTKATCTRNISILKLVLEHGAIVNVPDGASSLLNPILCQDIEMVSLLLRYGASVGFQDFQMLLKSSDSIWANANACTILQILLSNGLDVNLENSMGESLLQYAVKQNNAPIVNVLLTNGANLYHVDNAGVSILSLVEPRTRVHDVIEKFRSAETMDYELK